MSDLLVERHGNRTELALLEDGELVAYSAADVSAGAQPEAVYLGRVGRVMPSLNAAFVRLSAQEEGFLPFDEMRGEEKPRPGASVLVQVKKAAARGKAAYLTQDIALAGRYAVLLPFSQGSHVSARTGDDTDRKRLIQLAARLAPAGMALVMRSNALEAEEAKLQAEIARLAQNFAAIQEKAEVTSAPALLKTAQNSVTGMLRDLAEPPARILTNDAASVPDTGIPVETAPNPFLLYRVRDSLSKALRRRVHLKSGAELVIDPCEAMTVFDVNTAQATQDRNKARTILTANLEAVQEAARLMRLRNISGIVVMDLIDMDSGEDREAVLSALREALKRDPVKTVVHGFTALGLLEMTRRKTTESLKAERLKPCRACGGSGEQVILAGKEEGA